MLPMVIIHFSSVIICLSNGLVQIPLLMTWFMLESSYLSVKRNMVYQPLSTTEIVEILVAAKDVKAGGLLDRSTVRWQKWPKDVVRKGMISRKTKPDGMKKFESARARTSIYQGEPLNERKVVFPGESGFMAAILPKGMRAIAVRVSVETGAGGFIEHAGLQLETTLKQAVL